MLFSFRLKSISIITLFFIGIGAINAKEIDPQDLKNNSVDLCLSPQDVGLKKSNINNQSLKFNETYDAFPYVITYKGAIIGIYSSGVAHANSDKQVMFRSDDGGKTFRTVDFLINKNNSFNTSLLDNLLVDGDSINFKVWNIRKEKGVIKVTTINRVSVGSVIYSLWSRPVQSNNGLYRTGYGFNNKTSYVGLFESLDKGATWKFKSMIVQSDNLSFTEADIVNVSESKWIAIVRENKGRLNPLYQVTSSDNGITWSKPNLLDPAIVSGRQPNLVKLKNNTIILATGDRTGSSGYTNDGKLRLSSNTTGIKIFRSTDSGKTWSVGKRVSPIYSTDGGQPFLVDQGNNNLFITWYARQRQSSQPLILSCDLNIKSLDK
ncbi:hypothetical protein F966_00318 [Acinetobacter higginsii]|uniref:exo-alpha-sialidase n=1 Tax=Acinetobacter higginsii TaxID=70347 RepID=N8XNH0_9GAMM|nr:sialidase family protein [Acinetobacter higginsii]ENV10554.1 hypothetical protein F966_00318 [Acinetobacter higginsii]